MGLRDDLAQWAARVDWRHLEVVVCVGLLDVEPWELLRKYRGNVAVILFEPDGRAEEAIATVKPGWVQTGHGETWNDGVESVSVAGHLTDLRVVVQSVIRLGWRVEAIGDPKLSQRWLPLVEKEIAAGVQERMIQEATVRGKSLNWVETGLGVLPDMMGLVPLQRLQGTLEGRPAVVVGAGPSLGKDLGALRDLQGKAVIIAVNSAVGVLEDAGVQPDIITAVEALNVSVEPATKCGVWNRAIIMPGVHVHESAWHADSRAIVPVLQPAGPLGRLMCSALELAPITTGGSVSSMGYRIAQVLGCGPIALTGMDCAYSEQVLYAPGVRHEGYHAINDRQVKVDAWGGIGSVYAPPDLASYLNWWCDVAHQASTLGRAITNCSRLGARIDNTAEVKLHQWADSLDVEPMDHMGTIESAIAGAEGISRKLISDGIRGEIDRGDKLAKLACDTLPLARGLADGWGELTKGDSGAAILSGTALSPIDEAQMLPSDFHLAAAASMLDRIASTWGTLRPQMVRALTGIEERELHVAA